MSYAHAFYYLQYLRKKVVDRWNILREGNIACLYVKLTNKFDIFIPFIQRSGAIMTFEEALGNELVC